MRVLILDDDPKRHEEFARRYCLSERRHVTTVDEAIAVLLAEPPFDVIQLDHDLEDGHYARQDLKNAPNRDNTGYVVAHAICEMAGAKRQKRVIVHSWNRDGAHWMLRLFVEKGLPVEYRPFGVWE